MLRTWSPAVLFLVLWLPSVHAASQAMERHVYVTVLGEDGAPLAGLTTEHFAVRESGADRTVVKVEPLRERMHLALLVDTSAGDGLQDDTFRSAVAAFVERLAAFNEVALYAVGDRAATVVPFTHDAARLRRQAASSRSSSPSPRARARLAVRGQSTRVSRRAAEGSRA